MTANFESSFALVDEYGYVTSTLTCDYRTALLNVGEGETLHDMGRPLDPFEIYLNKESGTLRPKTSWVEPGFPATGKVDETILLQGIPPGTRVVWPDGFVSVETDGELSFESDIEGECVFTLKAPEYLKLEWTVHVTS